MSEKTSLKFSKHYPVKILLRFWVGIFILRTIGLLAHGNIKINTYFWIIIFVLSFISGFYLYFYINFNLKSKQILNNRYKNLNRLYYITIILSAICLITQLKKLQEITNYYSTGIDLIGINDTKMSILSDPSYQVGSNIYGVVSNMLFGFPAMGIVLAVFFKNSFKKKQVILLYFLFVLSILISFTTGGRFTAFVFIAIYFFARKFAEITKKSKYQNIIIGLFFFSIFYIFAEIFRVRLGSENLLSYIELQDFTKPGVVACYINNYLPSLSGFVNLYMLFEFYMTLSIDQLNLLFNSPYPPNAPYYGGYQFSTFNILLNKIGFDIISPERIVAEIVNPGVYFSMIGSIFLDWGFLGIGPFAVLLGLIVSFFWSKFRIKKSIEYLYVSILLLIILFMSPIIGMISTGYFPSIILSSIFLLFYTYFYPLPSKTITS